MHCSLLSLVCLYFFVSFVPYMRDTMPKQRHRNRKFVCTMCTNAFVDRAHLRAHEVGRREDCFIETTHSRSKLYACTVCNKRYARNATLKEHEKVHQCRGLACSRMIH